MKTEEFSLTNHFLIAMPTMADPHFVKAVAYVAEHNEEGALAIVINRPTEVLLSEILQQMDIEVTDQVNNSPVLFGGPVHQERGFVLHPPFGNWSSSFSPCADISITTSKDILQAIADDSGPEQAIVTLGYAGWGAGQLEAEIAQNTWLSCKADPNIVFNTPYSNRWLKAAELAGIKDIYSLSGDVGHA